MSKKKPLPEWEKVLESATRLQAILPGTVLVGGTASSVYAKHRISIDADHILTDLRDRFDDVLAQLESVAGWKTARINRPVQILGSLDGIETGVRQLIRTQPLETAKVSVKGNDLVLPSPSEILRIKGVLILKRNATRDYLDFAALSKVLGPPGYVDALRPFDQLYPQPNGASAVMQLQVQLSSPTPFDLDQVKLSEYKHLAPEWHLWDTVSKQCKAVSKRLFIDLFSTPTPSLGGGLLDVVPAPDSSRTQPDKSASMKKRKHE